MILQCDYFDVHRKQVVKRLERDEWITSVDIENIKFVLDVNKIPRFPTDIIFDCRRLKFFTQPMNHIGCDTLKFIKISSSCLRRLERMLGRGKGIVYIFLSIYSYNYNAIRYIQT